jgi:hypothetical protein
LLIAVFIMSGHIYYQPGASNSNGYVGQTIQADGKRESQHARAGKDTLGTMKLETGIPKADLNSREA